MMVEKFARPKIFIVLWQPVIEVPMPDIQWAKGRTHGLDNCQAYFM